MSVIVQGWVWKYADISGGTLLVLLALGDFAHDDGTGAYPSIPTLAWKSRLKERQTQRAVRQLQQEGNIEIEAGAGPHGVNLYAVIMDPAKVRTRGVMPTTRQTPGVNLTPPVPQDTPGVSSVTLGGVTEDTGEVSPSTPKPLEEPSYKPSREPRAWDPPDWFMPVMGMSGYRAGNHARACAKIVEQCREGGVAVVDAIGMWVTDYPNLKHRYGWTNPVVALTGKPLAIIISRLIQGGKTNVTGPRADAPGAVPSKYLEEAERIGDGNPNP